MKRLAILACVLSLCAACNRHTGSTSPEPPTTSSGPKTPQPPASSAAPTEAHIGVSGLITLLPDSSSITIDMISVPVAMATHEGEDIPSHAAYLVLPDSATISPK